MTQKDGYRIIYDRSELDGMLLGDLAEKKVADVLEEYKQKGNIMDYYQTKKNGPEDSRGVDFVVYVTRQWLPIPIQVKRSTNGTREHRRNHPNIPLIIAGGGDNKKAVRAQLQKIVHDFCEDRRQRRMAFSEEMYNISGKCYFWNSASWKAKGSP